MTTLALRDDAFRRIASLMYDTVGIAFGETKRHLVSSRLAPRLQRLGLASYEDYVSMISGNPKGEEMQVAIDLLTTNETYFFREPAHFELLERELAARRPRSVEVWSAACSFGDEAFTLAMLLDDLQRSGQVGETWSVLGTDVSDRVLRRASAAVFPEERLRAVSKDRLRRHCQRGEGEAAGLVRIAGPLRERVRFGWTNLCRPVDSLGPFDVVFLRNVLIYFDQDTKREVVDRVVARLRPGGLFFVGTAEGRVPCSQKLEPLAPGAFRRPA
ncbi:MAG: protein-glutamate O-methyltransferase CheR [Burkholderiaceae bacterium]|nr:protein-glutamate O-methyltransferase CheR [Burkholderiales bacterium]MCZ8098863.1 protein-glutamate O-methyltransferase CheR [Burkholderiales bacterium]MCZ8339175.1 protein-glutamate O-methyltransferase CheR [Burkholderiaceae bacterium]